MPLPRDDETVLRRVGEVRTNRQVFLVVGVVDRIAVFVERERPGYASHEGRIAYDAGVGREPGHSAIQ